MMATRLDARSAALVTLVTLVCVIGAGMLVISIACQEPPPTPDVQPAFDGNPYDTHKFEHDFHSSTFGCGGCHHEGAGFVVCGTCHMPEASEELVSARTAKHNTCRMVPCHGGEDRDENGLQDECTFCHKELLGE